MLPPTALLPTPALTPALTEAAAEGGEVDVLRASEVLLDALNEEVSQHITAAEMSLSGAGHGGAGGGGTGGVSSERGGTQHPGMHAWDQQRALRLAARKSDLAAAQLLGSARNCPGWQSLEC